MAMHGTNMVNQSSHDSIVEELGRALDTSVTRFPAAGGATLIFVALLRYIKRTPHDWWEWANIGTIGGAGIAYALLSILDIGSNKEIYKIDSGTGEIVTNSLIFKVENSGWVLPSFAILNIVVLIALSLENYFARRSGRNKLEPRNSTVYEPVDKAHHLQEDVQGSLSQQPVLKYMQHDSNGSFSGSHQNSRRKSAGPFVDPFSVRW